LNALFISNEKYIDPNSIEGGVKYCTSEYLELLKAGFSVSLFPVRTRKSYTYRFKKKLAIDAYEDYDVSQYKIQLENAIRTGKIDVVFLNLSNTVSFTEFIYKKFTNVKLVLCSHGNESGDFLHQVVKNNGYTKLTRILATYTLGKKLRLESYYRRFLDLVLTVSDVELSIEKWIGASKVYMVPRRIRSESVQYNPVLGRIGFFGDLSHAPNIHGILQLCDEINKLGGDSIEFRIVSSDRNAKKMLSKYNFVTYIGYLDNDALGVEASSWAFCMNPVFYYSRGVSTKLGKALSMGIPVITTDKGRRGYEWSEGKLLQCHDQEEMAKMIIENANDQASIWFYKNEVEKIQRTSPSFSSMILDIKELLNI